MKYKDKIINLFTEYCKQNNKIEIYFDPYFDNDDVYYLLYNTEKIKTPCNSDYLVKHKYNYDDFINAIYNNYGDTEIEYINDYIIDFTNTLSSPLKKYFENYNDKNNNDLLYDLQDVLHDLVDIEHPINDILNLKIKINLFYKKDYDGFLTYLLHTQHLLLKDHYYLKKLLNNQHLSFSDRLQLNDDYRKNIFLKSLIDEIENLYKDSYYQFCIIATVSIKDYFNMLEKNKDIYINKNCYCGLVDRISGGGSILNIQLNNDIKLNSNDIDIYIENIDKYTVDDIYGLTGSCFKQCITVKNSL